MNALAWAVVLTLILGWALEPHASQADFDEPGRPIVREPVPLGILHGSEGSIRIERREEGLRCQVLDARGNHEASIPDDPASTPAFHALPAADPRHGFAGVADLDLERTVDP